MQSLLGVSPRVDLESIGKVAAARAFPQIAEGERQARFKLLNVPKFVQE
jgi:hypothetical protein